MGNSIPYLIYVLIYLLLYFLINQKITERTSQFCVICCILVFVIFYGCAGFVQTDCIVYYSEYNKVPIIGSGIIEYLENGDFDKFFLLYISLVKTFGCDYHLYILINSIIDITLLIIILRRYLPRNMFPLFFIVFIAYQGLEFEFNLQRNTKSIFIFLISLKYVENRDLLKFFLLNIIGFLFHWTSFILFPLYFILNRKLSRNSYFGMIIFCVFLAFISSYLISSISPSFVNMFPERISDKLTTYLFTEEKFKGASISMYDIERYIWAIIIGLSYNKIIDNNKKYVPIFNLYILYMVAVSLGMGMEIIGVRLGVIFVASFWILILSLISVEKQRISGIINIFIILFSVIHLYSFTSKSVFCEYDNWLLNKEIIPYEERKERLDYYKKLKEL